MYSDTGVNVIKDARDIQSKHSDIVFSPNKTSFRNCIFSVIRVRVGNTSLFCFLVLNTL